ncbi:MAG TPA: FIST N-terminal domain-containing protein [Solirubrobacteraceae bacterium]|jgi:small ligand-binding sensory domain FIST|nr:FIST N-terminal domain-containing protein [Solirubrobacteraceae bacterium]
MAVRIGSGVSTQPDARVGAIEAAGAARSGLSGTPADLAVVFASGSHLAAPEATLEGVTEALMPRHLVGCGAGGVLAAGRELEEGTAAVVWAAAFEDADVATFHARMNPDDGAIDGLPELPDGSATVLLPDPYSFATDRALAELRELAPGIPVIGGISSARTLDGSSALFLGEEVVSSGAVGIRLEGVDVLPCVSQGAAPVGPELTITAADGHLIHQLAGAPALSKVRDAVSRLPARERALVAQGLLVGIVIEGGKPEYSQGDFLVRGMLGADPATGTIAVGASVEPGQVIQLHARDAESADRDLHDALGLQCEALGGRQAAGALCFTCNGRGRDMFGVPDHDARALESQLGGAPAAGFFAAGEIGPVGRENFLHGFTATVAIFAA